METLVPVKRSLETEKLVEETKRKFEEELKSRLNLTKVGAPLFVSKESGLNDDLNGVERPVTFELSGRQHQVVHSLAKWKRWYLGKLEVPIGEGIVTDMKAIRADEITSDIHAHLVDQWDWEKVITQEDRTIQTLMEHGTSVFESLKATERQISEKLEQFVAFLPETLKVIHTEELLASYPELTPKEREDKAAKEYGAILLIGIGGKLAHGEEHDLRAPDYDDWTTVGENGLKGLNADLIVWDHSRSKSLEISSMGVRVDKRALLTQLKETKQEGRLDLPFHKAILRGDLPYTIGGGIGQSRVAMFITREKEIGKVQPVFELR